MQAARRTTRTIFLGSAPSTTQQMIRGIKVDHILLGSVQPGQPLAVFEDVLKRLRDRLHYLYAEEDRFWFDTKPNLRREMESRKQKMTDQDDIQPLLVKQLWTIISKNNHFSGVHIFTQSTDIPDEYGMGPRLVVLPLNQACYSKDSNNQAFTAAEKILRFRGDQPRQKQNRLIFLAADFSVSIRLLDQAKTYLAWQSIVSDIKNEKLNLDLFQVKQAQKQKETAEQSLNQMLRETYKWLICPTEDFEKGKPQLNWEVTSVSTTATNLVNEIENRLKEEEWLIFEWSPIHLMNLLQRWYFKDGISKVSALKVWQDSCCYLYLPRMVNDEVFKNAMSLGLQSQDYFGFAGGEKEGQYLGFVFGENSFIILDDKCLLIERDAAKAYQASLIADIDPEPRLPDDEDNDDTGDKKPPVINPPKVDPTPTVTVAAKKHFYGTINLDPVKAKMDFATIVDEVIEQFTAKYGVDVKISVEIQATASKDGFDDNLQRSVKENCRVLKFGNAEFEEQ